MGRKNSGVEVREKSIRLHFTVDGVRHRQTLKVDGKPMLPTPANIKYANRLILEIGVRIETGTFSMIEYFPDSGTPSSLTVKEWLDKWLETQRIESSTRDGYRAAIKFWDLSICDEKGTRIGPLTLRALRHTHILTAIASRPDLTGKTINNYVSVLRDGLALAVKERLILQNPATDVPPSKHQKAAPDPFSKDEAEAIIDGARQYFDERIYNMIEAWFFSGLRTSEILGQRWPSIDLRSGEMSVAEVRVAGEQKARTKTSKARIVLMNSRSLAAYKRQEKHSRVAGEQVWLDPRYNEPIKTEETFQRVYWSRLLKRLGIRYRRPYNMRHTYATMMLMAGMTPAFCAKQLGHSVEMFLRTYAKWIDGAQNDREMARLESALSSQDCPRRKSN
jgi:integrase